MRIALDLPRFSFKPLGAQVYYEKVVEALLEKAPPEWEFVLAATGWRGRPEHMRRIAQVDPHGRARRRWIWLPSQARDLLICKFGVPSARQLFGQCQVVHSFGWQQLQLSRERLVVTIQDIIPLACEELDHREIAQVQARLEKLARAAQWVITISEFSKQELIKYLDIESSKVVVIPDGVDHARFQVLTPERKRMSRERLIQLGITAPYILFMGGQVPRKNLPALIAAFDLLKQRSKLPHRLVIAGSDRLLPAVKAALERSCFAHEILVTGYLGADDLLLVLQQAEALAFPSLYEGFGLPVLEAMACGVPVACSSYASLPEVAGDAAVFFDPLDPDHICDVLVRLLSDANLKQQCIERGLVRCRQFSWQANASRTLALYKTLE